MIFVSEISQKIHIKLLQYQNCTIVYNKNAINTIGIVTPILCFTSIYYITQQNQHNVMCRRVAYYDAFRMIHGLPHHTSACVQQILFYVLTFDAVIRKFLFNFVKRCRASTNLWI